MDTIADLQTRIVRADLSRPWVPEAPWLSFVETVVTASDGAQGYGFSWTPTIGAMAVQALLDHDIRDFTCGRSTDPRALWPELWRHLHELGGSGATTIAMAGLDLALWDLEARRAAASISALIGERRSTLEVYGSGVNLHYTLAELKDQAQRWVNEDYSAIKMKVGHPDLHDDVERVAAVREIIGPNRKLRIDANQRWNVSQAAAAIRELSVFDLDWVEEPLRAEDLRGYRSLKEANDVPIALGENVHTLARFEEFIEADIAAVLQPNVIRVGGITPFLEIAQMIEATGKTLAPHLLPDLSGQLALTLQTATSIEQVEDADMTALGILNGPSPVVISGSKLRSVGLEGLGMRFR